MTSGKICLTSGRVSLVSAASKVDMLEGKRIDYKYGFSDIFHSGDCIKMATGKWRSIYTFAKICIKSIF